MARKLQILRGLEANLPTLNSGELALTTDTENLYIGNPTGSGNLLVNGGGGPSSKTLLEPNELTTSATEDYVLYLRQTLNDPTADAGTQNFNLLQGDISVTSDTGWDTVNLLDLRVDGVSKLTVDKDGKLILASGTNINSSLDGDLLLTDSFGSDFGTLQFGGNTSAYPAIERSGAGLKVLAADGVAAANLSLNVGGKLIFDGDGSLGNYLYSTSGTNLRFYTGGSQVMFLQSSSLTLLDNKNLAFGTSVDQAITYNSATSDVTWNDGTNDVITIPDDTGQVKITGQIYTDLTTTETPAGNTQTMDFNNGNVQVLDLGSATGNVTLTFSNAKPGASYVIKVIQDATTPRNIIWPAAVKWEGGFVPSVSTGASAVDVFTLIYDGADFYAGGLQDLR